MCDAEKIASLSLTLINLVVIILIIYSSLLILPRKNNSSNKKSSSVLNVSYLEQQILSEKQVFLKNNTATEENEKGIHFSDAHYPLFFTGISSSIFLFLLIMSYLVPDKEYNCCCSCTEVECCCCGVGTCCTCYCCRKRKDLVKNNECNCCKDCKDFCHDNFDSNYQGGGGECDIVGCIISIWYLFLMASFIFIILYFIARDLGARLSRVVSFVFLLLFDLCFLIFGILQATNDGINTYSSLVIAFGIIGFILNLIYLILIILSRIGCIELFSDYNSYKSFNYPIRI